MARIYPYLILLSAITLGACASVSAQSDSGPSSSHLKTVPLPSEVDETTTGEHVKELPAPGLLPSNLPFSIENGNSAPPSIQVLSQDQLSRADRDLLADAQSSIQERAGFENLEFDGEGWTYHQLVCPAFPNHLFLRFTRDDGTRQMSMFSVAVPRNGNGRVHIIPIVRKGYSLFSPAPVGSLAMAAFNRIRSEEGAGASADWLGTGLCYAALTGANPELGAMTHDDNTDARVVFVPTLIITPQGGAIVRFADISTMPQPMEWTMTFDPKGKLTKAEHRPAYVGHIEKSKADVEDMGEPKP